MKQIKKFQIELNGSIGLKLKKNYQSHRYEEVIEFIERLEKICKLKMELAKAIQKYLFENLASKNLNLKIRRKK